MKIKIPTPLPMWVYKFNKWYKVPAESLGVDSSDVNRTPHELGEPVNPLEANLISSKVNSPFNNHKPLLDIDFAVVNIPSSTPGHSHLYFDILLDEDDMEKLVNVLVEVGILNKGIKTAQWDVHKELTVRPPWVKKGEEKSLVEQQVVETDS